MEWSGVASQGLVSLMSAGIGAFIATRPRVITALSKREAWFREDLVREVRDLRIDVDECREDRIRLGGRINELEHIISQQFNTVDTIGAFFKNIPTPAWMKDTQGRMYLINRRFEDIFGISHLAHQGRTDEDIWPEIVASSFRASDDLVLRRGRGQEFEEFIPARPLEPLSDENQLQKWNVWRFPVVVEEKLFGIGGIAYRLEG